jgi:hypothetical protein
MDTTSIGITGGMVNGFDSRKGSLANRRTNTVTCKEAEKIYALLSNPLSPYV